MRHLLYTVPAILMLLPSCMGYRKTQTAETLVGIGMDATQITLASGATITGLNTSAAIRDGSQAIKDLTRMRLSAGLIGKGVDAAKSISKEAIQ